MRWKPMVLVASHVAVGVAGFAAGVYTLPILTAPEAPTLAEVEAGAGQVEWSGEFRRDLPGSDLLHWGEGRVSVGRSAVTFAGRIAPGPAYMLYLTPEHVETGEAFLAVKARSARLGDVKTFENFIVPVPGSVDVSAYRSVVVWCESFSRFITAARYR